MIHPFKFYLFMSLCFCFISVSFGRKKLDPWLELEQQYRVNPFDEQFWDSLRNENGIKETTSLRDSEKKIQVKRERFVYEGGWGFLDAGYGIAELIQDPRRDAYFFSVKAMTNKFVSAFYRVRDFIMTTYDKDGLYPYYLEEHIEEGRYQKKRWTLFDHANSYVYTNKRKYPKVEIKPFTNDILTLLYHVRARNLAPGDTFTMNCFVHGKNYPVFFNVNKREAISVKAGDFNCVIVEPRLVGDGRNFTKNDRLQIWISDDERRIPVLIKSKIRLGSIVGELVSYEID